MSDGVLWTLKNWGTRFLVSVNGTMFTLVSVRFLFFFQAEDGIRDFCLSRGLGDVYKRQDYRGISV